MLGNSKYEQNAGQNSINLQGNNVHYHGLTYSEAKEIAQDVFEKNFRELTTEASEIATQRANEVREQIMDKLKQVEENVLESFKDPDVQYQIFNVQKEYARSGDENLADMLTDLLVERVKEPDRNLKQILLNESMSVLPKLTSAQVDILTWVFIVRFLAFNNVITLNELKNFLDTFYNPVLLDKSELNLQANYMHLQYAGCGNISMGEISFETLYFRKHSNLFPTKSSVVPTMKKLSPKVAAMADLWDNTTLKNFELTSVGITIAHSNMCRVVGIKPDLENWIR